MVALGIVSIVGVGALGVATGGVTATVALPEVIKGITFLVGGYLAAQGASDVSNSISKGKKPDTGGVVETKEEVKS